MLIVSRADYLMNCQIVQMGKAASWSEAHMNISNVSPTDNPEMISFTNLARWVN